MTELPISENREFNIEYYGKMKYEQGKKDGIKEERKRIVKVIRDMIEETIWDKAILLLLEKELMEE